jgi:hypothetical protein
MGGVWYVWVACVWPTCIWRGVGTCVWRGVCLGGVCLAHVCLCVHVWLASLSWRDEWQAGLRHRRV